MHIVRDLQSTQQISNTAIRDLVRQRINDLGGEAFDPVELGYFLVVEPGDTIETISDISGLPSQHQARSQTQRCERITIPFGLR